MAIHAGDISAVPLSQLKGQLVSSAMSEEVQLASQKAFAELLAPIGAT